MNGGTPMHSIGAGLPECGALWPWLVVACVFASAFVCAVCSTPKLVDVVCFVDLARNLKVGMVRFRH